MLDVARVSPGLRRLSAGALTALLLAVAAAVILSALAFEHIGG
jgi:hypothetical protein